MISGGRVSEGITETMLQGVAVVMTCRRRVLMAFIRCSHVNNMFWGHITFGVVARPLEKDRREKLDWSGSSWDFCLA